jgi:hypothetical protein
LAPQFEFDFLFTERQNDNVLFGATNRDKFDYGKLELPETKGVRSRVLRLVFKFLSSHDTLKCALVSNEWLEQSRCDEVWRSHFERDFVLSEKKEEKTPLNPPPKLRRNVSSRNNDQEAEIFLVFLFVF